MRKIVKKRNLIIFCFFSICVITVLNYSQNKTMLIKPDNNNIYLDDLDRKEYFIADVIEDENSYFLLLSKDMPKSKLEMTIDSSYALKKIN